MGCDIHFHVEQRTPDGWQELGNEDDWYDHRNYGVFAVLADVRNYPDHKITTLAAPRGLPEDLSQTVRVAAEVWADDGYSHSWFTIGELMAYDHWMGAAPPDGAWRVADSYWLDVMHRMEELAGDDPTSVRAVFWFDS